MRDIPVWLTKEEKIKGAPMESLKRSLLTSDGMGVSFKTKVLDELIERIVEQERLKNTFGVIK
jgi:hypothetical protein